MHVDSFPCMCPYFCGDEKRSPINQTIKPHLDNLKSDNPPPPPRENVGPSKAGAPIRRKVQYYYRVCRKLSMYMCVRIIVSPPPPFFSPFFIPFDQPQNCASTHVPYVTVCMYVHVFLLHSSGLWGHLIHNASNSTWAAGRNGGLTC